MINSTKYIKTDFYRLFTNYKWWLGLIAMIAICLYGMANPDFGILEAYSAIMGGKQSSLVQLVAVIAIGGIYVDDMEMKYHRYEVIRGNIVKYVFSKNCMIFFSVLITIVAGALISALILQGTIPFENESYGEYGVYQYLYMSGNYFGLLFIKAFRFAFYVGILVVAGTCFTTVLQNRMISFIAPIFLSDILYDIGNTFNVDFVTIFFMECNNKNPYAIASTYLLAISVWIFCSVLTIKRLKEKM